MAQDFNLYLSSLTRNFTSIINPSFSKEDYVALDLSTSNEQLDVSVLQDPEAHYQSIQKYLKENNCSVAYGGYLEQRKLYERSDYFQADDPNHKRNIHLGIDLWCDAGTEVLSPLEGIVHSFQENTNFGDYGPTIILEHTVDGTTFYSLYGHLSTASLEGKHEGQSIKAGEVIAWLGEPEVNGEYAPHLHFQLILDMEGNMGDYPGVCSQNMLEFYKKNCPDPNLLLKMY